MWIFLFSQDVLTSCVPLHGGFNLSVSGYHPKNEITVITILLMSTATWVNCSCVISQQRSGYYEQLSQSLGSCSLGAITTTENILRFWNTSRSPVDVQETHKNVRKQSSEPKTCFPKHKSEWAWMWSYEPKISPPRAEFCLEPLCWWMNKFKWIKLKILCLRSRNISFCLNFQRAPYFILAF